MIELTCDSQTTLRAALHKCADVWDVEAADVKITYTKHGVMRVWHDWYINEPTSTVSSACLEDGDIHGS